MESKVKLANAFSLNMLPGEAYEIGAERISVQEAMALVWNGFMSYVGHADTARLLSQMLEVPVEVNRVNLSIEDGDRLLVAQYVGPRLPEGATELPEGARIDFWLLTFDAADQEIE